MLAFIVHEHRYDGAVICHRVTAASKDDARTIFTRQGKHPAYLRIRQAATPRSVKKVSLRGLTLDEAIALVLADVGVTRHDLLIKDAANRVARTRARQLICTILHANGFSKADVALYFNRDSKSLFYAEEAVEAAAAKDKIFAGIYQFLKKKYV